MDKKIKELSFEIKNFNDKERTFEAIASTEDPDRYGDIILQEGWKLDEFLKNPVIPWGHDYYQPPVAKAEDVKVKDKKLFFKAKFPKKGIYPFADLIFDLFKEGIVKAFSVGFFPKAWDENEYGGITFKEQELLEISAVTIPANPNALALAYQKSIDKFREVSPKPKEIKDEDLDYIKMGFANELLEFKEMMELQSEVISKVNEEAVPSKHKPEKADEGKEWDATKAVSNLRKWASSDGSGEKDKIDWNKYATGFGYYDATDKENFGAYKLPHHDVINGKFVVVWRGVAAAMAALLGARGGVDMPDSEKRTCYNHLANHYKQFDKEPPEFETVMLISEAVDELKKEIRKNKIIESTFLSGLEEKVEAIEERLNRGINDKKETRDKEEEPEVKPEELKEIVREAIRNMTSKAQ